MNFVIVLLLLEVILTIASPQDLPGPEIKRRDSSLYAGLMHKEKTLEQSLPVTKIMLSQRAVIGCFNTTWHASTWLLYDTCLEFLPSIGP
jgi:hypothetical protein